MYIPKRADIAWLDFSPHAGSEQAHRRPALILSWSEYNKLGLCWTVPITSKSKGFFFELPLPQTVEKVHGYILTDQVRCFDWRKRNIEFIEKVSPTLVDAVISKAAIIYTE